MGIASLVPSSTIHNNPTYIIIFSIGISFLLLFFTSQTKLKENRIKEKLNKGNNLRLKEMGTHFINSRYENWINEMNNITTLVAMEEAKVESTVQKIFFICP